jgi:hypothetical protein
MTTLIILGGFFGSDCGRDASADKNTATTSRKINNKDKMQVNK